MPRNWCEISNLHKFNLEFQKYHKADRDTILRSERAATDLFIYLYIDLQYFGQCVFICSYFRSKNCLSENMIFDWMLFLELTFKDNSDH